MEIPGSDMNYFMKDSIQKVIRGSRVVVPRLEMINFVKDSRNSSGSDESTSVRTALRELILFIKEPA